MPTSIIRIKPGAGRRARGLGVDAAAPFRWCEQRGSGDRHHRLPGRRRNLASTTFSFTVSGDAATATSSRDQASAAPWWMTRSTVRSRPRSLYLVEWPSTTRTSACPDQRQGRERSTTRRARQGQNIDQGRTAVRLKYTPTEPSTSSAPSMWHQNRGHGARNYSRAQALRGRAGSAGARCRLSIEACSTGNWSRGVLAPAGWSRTHHVEQGLVELSALLGNDLDAFGSVSARGRGQAALKGGQAVAEDDAQ